MKRFAALLDRLRDAPRDDIRRRVLERYLRDTPDPDRGFALAALTGAVKLPRVPKAMLRTLAESRIDPALLDLSLDYVGALGETVALVWPERHGANRPPDLREIVEGLAAASRTDLPALLETWFDALDADGRWALLMLMSGPLRTGAAPRLVREAVAALGGVDPDEVELIWPALAPPYTDLFAWLDGRGPRPTGRLRAAFRPAMLTAALPDAGFGAFDPAHFAAEWLWEGLRVQAVRESGETRLYARTGEDITAAFPDAAALLKADAALDGVLIVRRDGVPAGFEALRRRLARTAPTRALLAAAPAVIVAFDLPHLETEDLRPRAFRERRAALEAFLTGGGAETGLSPLLAEAPSPAAMQAAMPPGATGLVLKRWDAPYSPGRDHGAALAWAHRPPPVEAVLMYAERGADGAWLCTFGVWQGAELVPLGKAALAAGAEDEAVIEAFVRAETIGRFGPVREVTHTAETGLVLEIAFEGLARAPRRRCGLALAAPRIVRVRPERPPGEAAQLAGVEAMLR
ncbi:MAG: cisplatin damage response ATP-dependent DNA ligase [Alphaproteobacteria bacterium]